MFNTLLFEKKNGIACIALNRPKVLNAMNRLLWTELSEALDDARLDPDIKVVVLTGQGRAFSTGADLKESRTRSPEQYRDYLEALQRVSRDIIRYEKPTIAAINGYALGSGYELALACDIRIASAEALIGSPEAKVASSVTGGAFRLVQQLIGPGKAKELLFSAKNIDGKEAERIGLVNKAVPPGELMDSAMQMAADIAANSLFSLKMIKRGLHLAQGEASLEALMDFEVEACLACVTTRDRVEALDDFEKRKEPKK
ncbi:MAG: enoyl-CoA hydratase/isomerase family protein [Desulfosarcinaceae bacterium]